MTTRRRKAFRLYRRSPGRAWLAGLVFVPLLLALIGYGMFDRSRSQNGGQPGPAGVLPTLVAPAPAGVPPGLTLAPLSITGHGNEITLEGNLPDPAARRTLLDMVIASMGSDVNVIDNLTVVPGSKALDFSAAGPVFEAGAGIRDFSLAVHGDTVTLAGTAATAIQADALENAAEDAWKNVNIVNTLTIESMGSRK